MKIANSRLVQFAKIGMLTLNYNAAPASEGYKFYKTIKALRKAIKELDEDRAELVKTKIDEKDLPKAQEYEKTQTGITKEEYDKITQSFRAAYDELLRDEQEVDIRPVSPEAWFAIKKDNEGLSFDLDDDFEGTFWIDPDKKAETPSPADV